MGENIIGYPSIDKPWLKYYSEEAINAPLPECTIYEYMFENNKNYNKKFTSECFATHKCEFNRGKSCTCP